MYHLSPYLFVLFVPTLAIDFSGLNFVDETLTSLANYHTSPCTYDALAEYIDQCSEKSFDLVDSLLRLQLAVKLSICEFEEASVEYPDECKHLSTKEDFSECVQKFRASSQLWTTYSGNYRKLRSLCYEESLPYTKYHIIELFANITNAYAEFYNSMKGSFHAASAQQDEMKAKIHQLLELVNDAIEKKKVQFDEFHQDTSTQMENLKTRCRDFLGEFAVLAKLMVDETLGIRSILHIVRDNMAALGADFLDVVAAHSAGSSQLLNAQRFESAAILHDLQSLSQFIRETNYHANLLEATLHHLRNEALLQAQIVLEEAEMLETTSRRIFNLLELVSGFHESALELTTELRLDLGDIGSLAGSTKELLHSHFQEISHITANLTHGLQSISNLLSTFPMGILSWVQTIAARALAIFAAIAIFTILTTTIANSIRLLPVSKFITGLIPGLFFGLILRLAWHTYHPSLLHISSLYAVL